MILVVGDVVDDIGVRPLEPVTPRSDTRAEIRMTPGGSAANVAAWLGHLGAPVRFVGRVGADAVDRHTRALTAYGVDARLVGDPLLPTATIVLTLDADADRTMYVDRAANGALQPGDIDDDAWDGIGHLHLTGYTFFDPATRPVALGLVRRAARQGATVSIDPASAGFIRGAGAVEAMSWFAGADLLLPNLDEARALTGATGPWIDVEQLLTSTKHLVLTLGSVGAAHASGDQRTQVVAPRVEVVDTTGAGDSFCAGFLSRSDWASDPVAALGAGAAAARECIVQRGARPSA